MITVLSGLTEEQNIVSVPGVQALCGSTARDALQFLLAPGCKGIVSFGVAGALHPEMKVGDLVVGIKVQTDGDRCFYSHRNWRDAIHKVCNTQVQAWDAFVYSSSVIRGDTPADRARLLANYNAWAVDDESWAVAQTASAKCLPFAVIRVISDTYDQTIPSAAMVPAHVDGSSNIPAILSSIEQEPIQLIQLAKIAYQFETAIKVLKKVYKILGPTFQLPV